MKLFVTGAAGFIGSNYVRHVLATTDDEVTIFDALTYAGNPENIRDLVDDRRCRFVHADICDQDAVGEHLPGHDAVVHFAAESHVDRSIKDPYAFVRTNCHGTNVLCDVARQAEVERFVHVSTDEVYGSIEVGSFTEDDRLGARSPYSAAKAGSDLIALSYFTTYGLPVVVTRSSNQFGPYQFPEKVIPLFVTNLLDGEKVPLYGDGMNVRDWLFVEDNVCGVDLVLRRGEVGEIYNIGAHNELPNVELTHKLLDLCDRDESFIQPVEDRLGHDRRYSITTDKVAALGWRTEHDLDDALARTVEWYRANRAVVGAAEGARRLLMVRLLVTGAGGQLGRDVVAAATAAGDEVVATDYQRLDVTDRDAVLGAITSIRPAGRRQLRGLDGRRRVRVRSRQGVPRQRPVRALARRGVCPRRRPPRAPLDRLRLRRNPRPARTASGIGRRRLRCTGSRSWRARSRPPRSAPMRPWCGHRGCAASTARTSSPRCCAWRPSATGRSGALAFVDDQRGHPTFTADLAPLLRRLALDRRSGVIHATNQGAVSWYEFVGEVLAAAGYDRDMVRPITTAELDPPRPAPRPANSVLDNAVLRAAGVPLLRDFREPLAELVAALRR